MTTEQDVALRVVKTALDAGYTVKHDPLEGSAGEDITILFPGEDPDRLRAALGEEVEGWLTLYRPNASFIGTIYLRRGNAEDGSELICDHTANPETEAVANKAYVSLGLNLDLYGEQS